MSIEYTAEDFAQANLATKDWFDVARRADPHLTHQWHVYGSRQGYFSDEEMAADGWAPVMEDAAHRRVATLLDTKKVLERTVHELRHDLKVAQKERERLAHDLRRSLGRPKGDTAITLDGLEAAWEAAEVTDECNAGDVLIVRDADGAFHVYTAVVDGSLKRARILASAPEPEPWADLADALRGTVWERLSGDVDGLAAAVHAAGWRKGGDDDE